MASPALAVALGVVALAVNLPAVAEDGLCKPLRQFIASVQPDETRAVKFRTSWGSNFKDNDEPALAAKRCDHDGYDPAKAVCDYLIKNGATEFSGNNASAAISCLSAQTRIATGIQVHAISVSFRVGTESRGSLIDIEFAEDSDVGGMLLLITAEGY